MKTLLNATKQGAPTGCRAPNWKTPQVVETAAKHLYERRRLLEQTRFTHIDKFARSEIEFTKRVIDELVPVKITWREDPAKFLDDLKSLLPFEVSLKDDTFVHGMHRTSAPKAPMDTADAVEPAVSAIGASDSSEVTSVEKPMA